MKDIRVPQQIFSPDLIVTAKIFSVAIIHQPFDDGHDEFKEQRVLSSWNGAIAENNLRSNIMGSSGLF